MFALLFNLLYDGNSRLYFHTKLIRLLHFVFDRKWFGRIVNNFWTHPNGLDQTEIIKFRLLSVHVLWHDISLHRCSLVLPDRFFSFIWGREKVWWTAYTIFVLQIRSFCRPLIGCWLVSTKNKEVLNHWILAAPIYKPLLLSVTN